MSSGTVELLNGLEAVLVLTLIILKQRALSLLNHDEGLLGLEGLLQTFSGFLCPCKSCMGSWLRCFLIASKGHPVSG